MWRVPEDLTVKNSIQKNRLLKPKPPSTSLEKTPLNIEIGVSIDKKGTLDIDDIFWIDVDENGLYTISIYIPDVTYYLKSNSLIEFEAKKQLETTYLPKHNPLLPVNFSVKYLRMTEGLTRRCLKLEFKYKKGHKIKLNKISKCYAKNVKAYYYKDADKILQSLNRQNSIDCMLEIARELTYELYQLRVKTGILLPIKNIHKNFTSASIISELMIMCNLKIGELLNSKKINALYTNIRDNYKINTTFYSINPLKNNNPYVNITSPIRRYVDIVNHRVLKSLIDKKRPYYTNTDLERISRYVNTKYNKYEEYLKNIKEDRQSLLDKSEVDFKLIKTKINSKKMLKTNEICYLIFEVEGFDYYKKTVIKNISKDIRLAYNVLASYLKANNIEYIKNIQSQKFKNLIASNIIVKINNDYFTSHTYGLGLNEEESIYNSCFNFLYDYVNSNLSINIDSIDYPVNYFNAKRLLNSSDEDNDKLKFRNLKTNIKSYIEKFLNKQDIKPSLILTNLQFKFKPVINNIIFKNEVNTYTDPPECFLQIDGTFFDDTISYSEKGNNILDLKESCSKKILIELIEVLQ